MKMNAEEFVQAIKTIDAAGIKGLLQMFENPPGRNPSSTLLSISRFFKKLEPEDKEIFREALKMASADAWYSVLLMVDGLMAFEPVGPKGTLEFIYTSPDGTEKILLNDPDDEYLSTLFKSDE